MFIMLRNILFFIAILLFSAPAWATYPNYTVCPSACDYTTLNGAVSDISTNHATFSQNVTITISGSWSSADTTAVTISGMTMGSYTLTITATGTARTNGVYQATGAYTLAPASSTAINITGASNLTIDGLQFLNSSSTFTYSINIANYQSGMTFKNNLFLLRNNTQGSQAISWNSPRGANYVYNNVAYVNGATVANYEDFFTSNSSTGDGSTSMYIYNNTAYNVYDGIDSIEATIATQDVSNNVMMACTDHCYINHAGGITSGSYNFASDTTAAVSPLTNGTNSLTTYTSYFNSPSTYNLNLITGSPFIASAGNNFSSTFTTDIAGSTRQASGNWDAGAFYFQPPPTAISIIQGATIRGATIK